MFVCVCIQGSKLSTVYTWSFNDSTPSVMETGLSSAQSQEYSFNFPGTYRVSVQTINEDGVSQVVVVVLVVGK